MAAVCDRRCVAVFMVVIICASLFSCYMLDSMSTVVSFLRIEVARTVYRKDPHFILYKRLGDYNNEIQTIRSDLLKKNLTFNHTHNSCVLTKAQVADGNSTNYFSVIQGEPDIKTIFLRDDFDLIKHYLRSNYYDYASNDCDLMEERDKYGRHFAERRYGFKCHSNLSDSWQVRALPLVALGAGIPNDASRDQNNTQLLTYIHVIPDAISYNKGDVFHKSLRILPPMCFRSLKKTCPKLPKGLRSYKEVFTISQHLGKQFYHGTIEILPRIAPYLDFLQKHPEVLIHVPETVKYLPLLDVDPSRLIRADVLHADLLYMPAGSFCFIHSLFAVQVLASRLNKAAPAPSQDMIVLIKRRHRRRWFDNHNSILRMLEKHASRVNLTVRVFDDSPVPSVQETINIFSRAQIVVAPHGAGESNLIFSQPGTFIIEGICDRGDGKANHCYRNLALAMGFRFYGLTYRFKCMKITAEQVEKPLLEYLFLQYNYQSGS